jgi:hypothetical protein
MAARSPDLKMLDLYFMGHIKMYTRSTAFKDGVQVNWEEIEGRYVTVRLHELVGGCVSHKFDTRS